MLLHIRQFLVQQNTEVTSNTGWLMVAKTTVSERSTSETLGNPKTREKMPFFWDTVYVCLLCTRSADYATQISGVVSGTVRIAPAPFPGRML